MKRGRRTLAGGPSSAPPATAALLFPDALASAVAKFSPLNPLSMQAVNFQNARFANLALVKPASYYYDQIGEEAVGCAVLYRCLRDFDPTSALDYAGKAIGLALSMARDSHRDAYGPWQFVAQGDGSTTTFSIPGTVVSSSFQVVSYPLAVTPITKGASGGKDDIGLFSTYNKISKIVKLVATNSVTASPGWISGTDYQQVAFKDVSTLAEEVIDWSLGGSQPSTGSTYYAVSAPVIDSAFIVSPSNYTVGSTTFNFNTAPANDRGIFISCLYHDANHRYQQTGNGLGGVPVMRTADNLYPIRYIGKAIGLVLDYCYDELTNANLTELANFLVSCSDLSRDATYAPAEWIESNYGAGNYINRMFIAVALQGRHAQASRLQTEVESLYTTSTTVKFSAPASNKSSLKNGFPGEGLSSYGQETTEHAMLGTAAIAFSGWDLSPVFPLADVQDFATTVIQFNLHARYAETGNTQVPGETRPGSCYEGGDNGYYPCPSVSKRIYAIASGLAGDSTTASYARYLINNKTGDITYDGWDILFRDGTGTTTDWGADASFGTTFNCRGRNIYFARSDWTYASAWMAYAAGNRGDCDHDEPGAGDLTVYRGSDKLLPTGSAIGKRYNPDPSGPWSNIVTIDDLGANLQLNRWSSTQIFSEYQGIIRPGIASFLIDESNGTVYASTDFKAIYAKSAVTNSCTLLERDVVFIPASGYVFVYDRCDTAGSYPKHLRYHKESSTHPVGSGTVTISNSSGSTGPLAWNASAATMQTALRGLSGTGYSSCTVTRLCDGYWIVTFTSGLTIAAMTGTASASGAIVESYDFHPEGASGALTIQHLVLAATLSGTEQIDLGSSRMFRRVDSSDTLTKTDTLIDAGLFVSALCRRESFRQTTPSTSARYATFMQVTTPPTTEVANSFLTGSSSKLQGYRAGTQVVLFRMSTSFTPPDTVSVTATGTLTWHVFGLVAGTVYDLTGAVEDTATANTNGVLYFTTNTTNPSVTIAAVAPPAATYSHTLDDPGIAADLASWYTSEASARPTSVQWRWMNSVRPDPLGTNFPHIVIGNHSYAVNPGHRIYKNTSVAGGAISFTNATVTDYAVTNAYDLGGDGGLTVSTDLDGDGDIDHITCVDTSTSLNSAWLLNASNHLINQAGMLIAGYGNYVDRVYDSGDGTGLVDFDSITIPFPASLTSLSQQKRNTLVNSGSSFSVTTVDYPIPAGVPGTVTSDVLSRLQSGTVDKGRFVCMFLDLDNDGTDELIITIYFSYESQKNCAYYLKDTGGGTYVDKTSDWGLPRMGTFMQLSEPGMMPRVFQPSNHLHKSIDGTGAPHIFIAGGPSALGGSPGMYRWNGAGFTKQSSSPVTTRLTDAMITGSSTGDPDNYLVDMYAWDATNSNRLDLLYHRPLGSMAFIFLNNGSGVFTQYATGTSSPWSHFPCWGPYGPTICDLNNDGLLDIAMGGKKATGTGGGHGSQPEGRNEYAVLRNTTTSPGRYLKVYLRRSTTQNKLGIGAIVACYTAGTSTLLRQWQARHDGEAVHFGLGAATTVDLKVFWADGTITTQTSVATNQTITVTS